MYQDLLKNVSGQFAELTAPAQEFNRLVVDNLEKLSAFQLESAKSYTDLTLQQLRAALEVNDAATLQAYVSNQSKVASQVSEKLSADAKSLASLGQAFTSDMQKLTQESAARLGKVAKVA